MSNVGMSGAVNPGEDDIQDAPGVLVHNRWIAMGGRAWMLSAIDYIAAITAEIKQDITSAMHASNRYYSCLYACEFIAMRAFANINVCRLSAIKTMEDAEFALDTVMNEYENMRHGLEEVAIMHGCPSFVPWQPVIVDERNKMVIARANNPPVGQDTIFLFVNGRQRHPLTNPPCESTEQVLIQRTSLQELTI